MQIVLDYVSSDGLSNRQYTFWFDGSRGTLWLDDYLIQTRETRRRKFKTVRAYRRLSARDSTLTETDVPLLESVKTDAIAKLIENVQVKLWSDKM
jgi:hypothetical protein